MPVLEQDFETLSAYLDGQLPFEQRRALEARLAEDAALRAALDDLRATLSLLQAAPRLLPPRNFTLDPAKYARAKPWWARYGAMQTIGAVGALASAALIILVGVFFGQVGNAVPAPASNLSGSGGQDAIALVATATASAKKDHLVPQATSVFEFVTETPQPAVPAATVAALESANDNSAAAPSLANVPTSQPTTIPATSQPSPPPPPTTLSLKSGAQPAPLSAQAAQGGAAAASGGAGQPGGPYAPQMQQSNNGAARNAVISPTSTPSPTATATFTATPTPTETHTPSETPAQAAKGFQSAIAPTSVALAATQASLAPSAAIPQPSQVLPIPQLLMILAIALFVFFAMLFGIGWMRRRLEGTINDRRE